MNTRQCGICATDVPATPAYLVTVEGPRSAAGDIGQWQEYRCGAHQRTCRGSIRVVRPPATYDEALAAGRTAGASHASDEAQMALFCDSSLQLLAGAVSPRLVWNGAQASGLTSMDLLRLVHADPSAVADLMWTEKS